MTAGVTATPRVQFVTARARPELGGIESHVAEVAGRADRSALVVPAGDDAALAAALVRMYRDPTLRDRLREGARERVREFVQSRVAERYDTIYADVVARVRATS